MRESARLFLAEDPVRTKTNQVSDGEADRYYMNPPHANAFVEAFWYLVSMGIILPQPHGNTVGNFNFLMLTPLGREWVQGQDPSPEDETGYLAVLTGQITNLDPIIMDYVKEAVAAYSQRLHFASAVMIGAASEKAVYLLMEAFSKSAKDPIIQRKTTNAMEERKLPGMFSCLSANLTEAKKLMPYPIHEGCGPHLTSLLEAIRVQRNEAVHPMSGQVTAQSVMADLRYAGSLLHESSVVSGSEFSVVKVLSPEDGGHRDHKQCETSKKEHMGDGTVRWKLIGVKKETATGIFHMYITHPMECL